jgi:RNA polymerase sigma factor (sigma-70 family)
MTTGLKQVLEHLQQAGGGLTDGQLLGRFIATRDETSFAALVRRHGPMVLGVCRRVLGDFHDAEDAFQATFLVLARRASSVLKRESVGCWLHGVAYHTALRAVAALGRRRSRERPMSELPHPQVGPAEPRDWLPVLDRELNLLPERYRAAIVACDLEGRTRKEAAGLLGVTEGTLSSRLARGRTLLAKRLTKGGVALSGGALAIALSHEGASAAVTAPLLSSTARAAGLLAAGQVGAVSTTALLLMKGVMKTMLLKKLRLVAGAVVVLLALGAIGIGYQAGGGSGSAQAAPPDKPRNELEALRRENELLKLNLEVVLEKVRAQEAELRELRARGDSGPPRRDSGLPRGSGPMTPGGPGMPEGGSGMPRTGPGGPGGPPGGADLPGGSGVPPGPGTSSGGGPPRGSGSPFGRTGMPGPSAGGGSSSGGPGAPPAKASPDPLQQAEAALKALREANDSEGQRRATEALEKALEKLKQRQAGGKKGPGGE